MLKSRVFIRSFILNMLPEAVYQAEDWNILFGDGNGENLLGIANHKGVYPLRVSSLKIMLVVLLALSNLFQVITLIRTQS